MTATAESYSIASGWDVALGSLVNVENITPTNDVPFDPPKGIPGYEEGNKKVRGDGLILTQGYANVTWHWTRLTYAQYAYLKSTYCSGGLSGQVTIYTTLGSASYSRMNAIMFLPMAKELRGEYGRYLEVDILFTHLKPAA